MENNEISEKNIDKNSEKKKSKKGIWILSFTLIVIAILAYSFIPDSNTPSVKLEGNQNATDSNGQYTKEFIDAATVKDTSTNEIIMSSPDSKLSYSIDQNAGKYIKVYQGRRINIAVTGLDSRLGTTSNHADANHIISILLDSGKIEITSIPRDTPARAGYSDSSNLNKLTVVRAARGREAYLKEAARIAGYDRIHYYVEVGFSQVMGILELLGYSDAKSTLQVLRSRKGLGGDDFQRCYNQGQFIRQMLLRHFSKLNGGLGELLIRGGLALVESNMTANDLKNIIYTLRSHGFPHSANDIVMRVRPAMNMNFKVYDFASQSTFKNLQKRIESFNKYHENDSTLQKKTNVTAKLMYLIRRAAADSTRNPKAVIAKLEIYFNQRAWFQAEDPDDRIKIRDSMATLLISAYNKRKMPAKANHVIYIINSEKQMFQSNAFH